MNPASPRYRGGVRTYAYHHRAPAAPLLGVPIHVHVEAVAARHADREAVVAVAQARRLTYRDLVRETDRLARGLMALGVARGERVGIWSVDNVEWILVQLATAKIGAVLVNVNPANRQRELEHVLDAAGVRTLIHMPAFRHSDYAGMVAALDRSRFPLLRECIEFDPDGSSSPAWTRLLEHGVPQAELERRADSLEADDPINIQFTSGTTGVPKPVVLTHHNILNNACSCADALGFTAEDRLCVPLPFYHCFGMVVSILGCLGHGACVVVPAPHFDPEATLRAVQQERCTALHGVPTMFVAELELPGFRTYDLGSLRTGIMAGAPCPPELMRRVVEDMGIAGIRIGYGLTEASPVTHMTRADDTPERRIATVGCTMPGQECRIVDPRGGATLPLDEQGEVVVRGYNVMRGYHGLAEATRATIDEAGWLHTGDLGVMDADGYVRITGRLKDMIIRGGENVYPAEIEACLDEHPAVAQAAVFGVPDERMGEEVAAWVQLHEGATASAEDLLAHCRARLAHHKVPRFLRVVTEFPLTVTGKIQKYRMRDQAVREAGTAGRPAPR